MNIDHIFIFTTDKGQMADELVAFGLTEGSNRTHVGQGTANRKFYFDNFFLEILWVTNEEEIQNDLIKPTGLWQRAGYAINGFSPFGLCIVNNSDADVLFKNPFHYQPAYFPTGSAIEILKNEHQPDFPWTFRLPFKGQKKNDNEPTHHTNGIQRLTKAKFSYSTKPSDNYLDHFRGESAIEFAHSLELMVTLTFDNHQQGLTKKFEKLSLLLEY